MKQQCCDWMLLRDGKSAIFFILSAHVSSEGKSQDGHKEITIPNTNII
jgi:hypothetical protein